MKCYANQLPPHVNWRITSVCDFGNCKFCYSPRVKTQPTYDRADKICEALIKSKINAVVISGGEPLTQPWLPKVIKKLHNNSISVNLSTNGLKLLKAFPDYYRYVDVLALPIDGDNDVNDSIRGTGHYEAVRKILIDANKMRAQRKTNLKIKIETVSMQENSSINTLEAIYNICKEFNVDVWKIFEYNHYPDRNKILPIFNHLPIKEWVDSKAYSSGLTPTYYSKEDRNKRYFIINPDGRVVIPTLVDNEFRDVDVGNLLGDKEQLLEKWWNYVDLEKYAAHYDSMYESVYFPDEKRSRYLISNDDDAYCWKSVVRSGMSRLYSGENDFQSFRFVDGKVRNSLTDYLDTAKKSITMISYGMGDTIGDLINFLRKRLQMNPEFSFTLILPQLGTKTSHVIAKSIGDNKIDFYDLFEKKVKIATEAVLLLKQERGNADTISIRYTGDFIFGSTILIDRNCVQIESKYVGVTKTNNLVLEFRKRNDDDGYFETQLAGIDSIVNGSSESIHPTETDGIPTANRAFIIMAIDKSIPGLNDILKQIEITTRETGIELAKRIDGIESNEPIVGRILQQIESARVIICDLTHERPNVYYEAGYATAIGNTPIYIAKENSIIHFDLKDYPVIFFTDLQDLHDKLKKRIEAIYGNSSHKTI